jgi:parallel beta-helix repeat protein
MIIRNNTVHDNGSIGIICSLDCYHITIENNVVYNNTKSGIFLSRNIFNSVVRNNVINNEEKGIVISESHDNEIYNNKISDTKSHAIDLDKESYRNVIHDNTITIPTAATTNSSLHKSSTHNTNNGNDEDDVLYVEEGAAKNNKLYSNNIYK